MGCCNCQSHQWASRCSIGDIGIWIAVVTHHQDVSDHLHALVVVLPSQLELSEEALPLRGLYLGCHHSQVLGLGLHQAIVQPVAKGVDDYVVGTPENQRTSDAL